MIANDELKFTKKYLFFVLFFCMVFLLIVVRRPDIIKNAQPWAEDGLIWLQTINNNGFWYSLFLPQNGYYQTISRLVYGSSLLFGIKNVALIANIIAISIRCFMVLFLLSNRMRFCRFLYRMPIAVYFIFMPNVAEGYVNITNAHWYLAMYLMMVLVADKPDTRMWKIHDLLILVVSSLSGPFVAFFAPCLFIKRYYERGGIIKAIKGIDFFDVVMIICVIIQGAAIIFSSTSDRSSAPLGASIALLADIISYRVVCGTFLDSAYINQVIHAKFFNIIVFSMLLISILGLFVRAGWRFKILALFPILMIGFALAKPMISMTDPQWPVLLNAGAGERYFIVTNLFFFSFVVYIFSKLGKLSEIAVLLLSIAMLPLYIQYFNISPLAEVGYKESIDRFIMLNKGESMDIDINPPGWKMHLIKR